MFIYLLKLLFPVKRHLPLPSKAEGVGSGDETTIQGTIFLVPMVSALERFHCMYVCIWPCGAFVLPMFPRSHVRVNIDRAPWCNPHVARYKTRLRIGDVWIDFYKVRVLPGSDNEQQSHLITELYDWSDNWNTRAEGLLLCICRKMDCSWTLQNINQLRLTPSIL